MDESRQSAPCSDGLACALTTDPCDGELCAGELRFIDDRAVSALHRKVPLPASPSGAVITAAGDLLRTIAAPVRIAIVLQLNESPCCVHELVDALQTPQSLVSQHLRILKAARVVAGQRAGREVVYRLVDDHLARIVVAAVIHAAEDPTIK